MTKSYVPSEVSHTAIKLCVHDSTISHLVIDIINKQNDVKVRPQNKRTKNDRSGDDDTA